MIEAILTDAVELTPVTNESPFESSIDYAAELKKRDEVTRTWKTLSAEVQAEHENKIESYIQASGILDLKSPEAYRAKNLFLLRNEVAAHIKSESPFKLLSVEELHFSSSLIELLENAENAEHIRELYKLRKRTTGTTRNAGISVSEAQRLKNCMKQGRELYQSGRAGSLMVKPLNFFYALTAYAYAVVILNNPVRYVLDGLPGSHGLNYLPDQIRAQFGGDIKQGTFSDLFTSFPSSTVRDRRTTIIQDNEASILAFYKTRTSVGTGTLLSMVPEIREYYSLVTGKPSRTFPLEITTVSDPRSVKWELQIGDGETRPATADIDNAFGEFQRGERHGKTIVTIPFTEAHKIRATIYSDIRGRFWYIENPFFPIVLPELCLHFLLTNAFSNIMRYSPDHWGEILLNQVRSDISLITRKYLSAFENKFPVLLLRSLSKFHPYVSAES
ncbi:YaaC family protein [Uliginosibacterium sediminicola]|uniref:YaaC family protein n=1 Tax=Uliginosibacterium sediminicola TaxID=2024550 RepID=A0ABU9YZW3_9RHOO